MDPLIGSALVSGGIGLFSNLFGTAQNNTASASLAKYQNEWNLAQWHRENEYNLPKNQVQRLVDAGINPRSPGAVTSAPSASSPQAANADYQSPLSNVAGDLQNIVQLFMSAKQMEKDLEVKDSEIQKNNASVDKDKANALKLLADSDLLKDKRLFEQLRFENWGHRQGILTSTGIRELLPDGRMKYSLGSYSFDPEYFGIDSKKTSETVAAIVLDNQIRKLKKTYEEDRERFRHTTGFNTLGEVISFLMTALEMFIK